MSTIGASTPPVNMMHPIIMIHPLTTCHINTLCYYTLLSFFTVSIQSTLSTPSTHPLHQQVPVFIVGMLRSGSTLLETMLNVHDDVVGLGEHSFFASHQVGS